MSYPTLAPCGVYCGACPSFGKTCLGCASQELGGTQKRKSKWSCKLRVCCYDEKGLEFCSACDDYPCTKYKKKLTDSHPGDPRFIYRHEVENNLVLLSQLGQQAFLEHMDSRFTCPECGGRVVWYDYRCTDCGVEVTNGAD
jgi:hypothetical protein